MIRERVDRLLRRLTTERQFPTQGRTLFIDLERREVRPAYAPRRLVDVFLGGRGLNMFYLANLLDPSLEPLNPEIPLIYGAGIGTEVAHAAGGGRAQDGPPDTKGGPGPDPPAPRLCVPGEGAADESRYRPPVHEHGSRKNSPRAGDPVPLQAVPPDLGDGHEE